MSKACCDKWEEEALGNPDSGAAAATASTRFVGEVPSLMFTPRQEGALLARQGYPMMGMRGQQVGQQSMPLYNRGEMARQVGHLLLPPFLTLSLAASLSLPPPLSPTLSIHPQLSCVRFCPTRHRIDIIPALLVTPSPSRHRTSSPHAPHIAVVVPPHYKSDHNGVRR